MSKTLILIDGHALAYRQFFALERTGMKNSDNQPTWAVYGFFKAIFDYCGDGLHRMIFYIVHKYHRGVFLRYLLDGAFDYALSIAVSGVITVDVPVEINVAHILHFL